MDPRVQNSSRLHRLKLVSVLVDKYLNHDKQHTTLQELYNDWRILCKVPRLQRSCVGSQRLEPSSNLRVQLVGQIKLSQQLHDYSDAHVLCREQKSQVEYRSDNSRVILLILRKRIQ
jgi:invasion protein IalB